MQTPKPGEPIAGAPSPNPLRKYSLLGSGAALERYALEQTPLLGNICLHGEATVWYARYNTGKTALCIHLILEAVREDIVQADNIYYINADDSSAGLAEKVKLFEDIGVHMLAPGHRDFDISALMSRIEEMIDTDTAKGVVIIIDTLKRVVDVMDKKAVRAFTGLMRRFVMKQGTVLALAHTNKTVGKDGRPVPEGTADVLSDFDCAYLLNAASEKQDGLRVVGFSCVKSRGKAASEAWYEYDPRPDLSYTERLCTIREVDPEDRKYAERPGFALGDDAIIDAIFSCMEHSTDTKMEIVRVAAEATRSSRRAVLKVLEEHTGDDPDVHRWNYTVQDRGKMVFAPLRPPEAQA